MNASAAEAPRSRRGLVGVLAAQAVVWTGSRFSTIALPWFVLSSTGSAVQTGTVVFAQLGCSVTVQALAGPLIDRLGSRRVSITGDLVAAGAMAGVPLLFVLAGGLPLWVLLALVATVGAADGPATAAKAVLIPEVTRAARMPLERGTGLSGSLVHTAATLGPGVAGLVVAAVGGAHALWVTAALYAVGALIIAATVGSHPHATEADLPDGYLKQLRQGATFLRTEPLLRSLSGMLAAVNLLNTALVSVALPVWALSSGHSPSVIGLLVSVMSGVSIAASLLAAMIGHRLPRRAVYLVAWLIAGAPRFVVIALGAPLWLAVGVYAVAGLGAGVVNPIVNAIQYERIPAAMLGRVRTLATAVAWSGVPFGALTGGAVITLVGLSPALLLFGAGFLIVAILPALQKAQWERS